MFIRSLDMKNFRNYRSLMLEFSPGTNLFYGDNAQGKTNVLEAIYFCGTTRSHRTSRDRDLIQFGENEAHLRMHLEKRAMDYQIDMHLRDGRAKGIAINSVAIRRAQELIGLGNFVFFSPEDLSIIKDGPAERRHFLDMELCQMDKVYVDSLSKYNKVLVQRNKLLKELGFHPQDMGTLDVWDAQLVHYGRLVIEARKRFVEKLSVIVRPIHAKLSGGLEDLLVEYEGNVSASEMEGAVLKSRERDLFMKSTEVGPHRDDLSFQVNGIDIRRFGSQGQQRSAALSLKLAEIELVKESSRDVPVLLMDDVLSELDTKRQHDLLDSIGQIQTFISCTGLEEYENSNFRIDRMFHVKDGGIMEG